MVRNSVQGHKKARGFFTPELAREPAPPQNARPTPPPEALSAHTLCAYSYVESSTAASSYQGSDDGPQASRCTMPAPKHTAVCR